MARVRIADLPTTSKIDPESFVIIERPGYGDGTFKSTVSDLQRVITVTAKVEQLRNITKILIDDINGHTEAEIFTPKASIRDNGDGTLTITIVDGSGRTEETLFKDTRTLDPVPTEGSNNLVSSGTVYNVQQAILAYMDEYEARLNEQMKRMQDHLDAMIKDTTERILIIEAVVDINYNAVLTLEDSIDLITENGEQIFAPMHGSIGEMRSRDGYPDDTFYTDGYIYSTLSEAILAVAPVGGTVTLLSNASNEGLAVPEGSSFILDLNGYRLDVVGPGAGSPGTQTNGLQLLKDSNITIKNGILVFDDERLKIGIQNYSNLTLDNVNVYGGPTIKYVVSNNFGNVRFTNGSEIHAYTGKVAFDAWYGMFPQYDAGVNITVDEGVVIDGIVEFGKANRATKEDFEEFASITCPETMYLEVVELTSPCAWTYNGDGTRTLRYAPDYEVLLDESSRKIVTQQDEELLAPVERQ